MRLIILEDSSKAGEWAAKYVRNTIKKFSPGPGKFFVLGLPTGKNQEGLPHTNQLLCNNIIGSTPLPMYKKLIEFYEAGELSFKYVKTFNMDEYVGLPDDHPESYHYFMYENFFKHIDIDPGIQSRGGWQKLQNLIFFPPKNECYDAVNVHILNGNAEDTLKECHEFEEKITQAGGVDLFIGGKCLLQICQW